MSKGARLRAARVSATVAAGQFTDAELVRICILTTPEGRPNQPIDLSTELRLLRASVLYADEVELVSLGAELMECIKLLQSGGSSAIIRMLSRLDDATLHEFNADKSHPLPEGWRDIVPTLLSHTTASSADPRVQLARDQVSQLMEVAVGWQDTLANQLLSSSGMREIDRGIAAGIVRLARAGVSDGDEVSIEDFADALGNGATLGQALGRWQHVLAARLSASTSGLLLDDTASAVARDLISRGDAEPQPSGRRLSAIGAMGTGLIARLPAFPGIPLDELLDLRADLDVPLSRYRTAAARLSAATWGEDFAAAWGEEVEAAWVANVRPALIEIEDGLTEHGLIREFARAMASEARLLVTAGATVLPWFGSLGTIQSSILTACGASGSAVQALLKASDESRRSRRSAARNDLYYLVELRTRMGR